MHKVRKILFIILVSLLPTILLWVPFFLRLEKFWGIPLSKNGMATIVANYDGPLFLVVAKTLYDKELIMANFPFNLPAEYYPAHFPLFPLLIRLFSPLVGYPYSMLAVTVFSSILAIYFFQKLISDYIDKHSLTWATFVFAIFPARWLIVRSVGSAEPLFLATTIASIYYFNKKNYLLAGIFGALSTITKSPGILLFFAFLFSYLFTKFKNITHSPHEKLKVFEIKEFLPILLIPLSLLGVFYFYKLRVNDFFAYFHSGDNIHLFFPPFKIFDYSQTWVGTFWLEEIILIYLFNLAGLIRLIKQKQYTFAFFTAIFFISTIFVSHRDLLRYSLPMIPFLYIAFSEIIVKREFKIIILFLLIPIYLFSLAFISQNVMPIPDWSPLL